MPWSASAALAAKLRRREGSGFGAEHGSGANDESEVVLDIVPSVAAETGHENRERREQQRQQHAGASTRRKGMLGDRNLRAELKEARDKLVARASAVVVPSSGSEDEQGQSRPQSMLQWSGGASGSRDESLQELSQPLLDNSSYLAKVCRAGDDVQQKLLMLALASESASQGSQQDVQDTREAQIVQAVTGQYLFQRDKRMLRSLGAEAELLEMDRMTLRSHVQATAAALVESAGNAWSGFLSWLQEGANAGRLKLHCLIRSRSYDETPLRFRVSETGHSSAETTVVKTFQTRLSLGMVVELDPPDVPTENPKLAFIQGSMPVSLQPLEHARAPDILKAQTEVLDSIPGIRQLTQAFPCTINIATSDRFSANLLAAARYQGFRVMFSLVGFRSKI